MGREAFTRTEIAGEVGNVRALLESTELILRGDIRRRFPRDRLVNVLADRDGLHFECDGENVCLHLDAAVAESWAKAIATPPPSLRAKLGLAEGARALRIGAIRDAELSEAVAGVLVDSIEPADILIACIAGPADLEMALSVHAIQPSIPLWTIYAKGKGVVFGDREIRNRLRAIGFRDTNPVPYPIN